MATGLEELPDATEETATTAPTTQSSTNPTQKKRKKTTPKHETTQFSIRKPDWTYIRLQHLSPGKAADLDNMTAHMHLNAALSSFLGLHGSAIAFDILKLEGQDVWIRVHAEDRAAVIAATGGWFSKSRDGWRVRSWSHWNAGAAGRDAAKDLFDD